MKHIIDIPVFYDAEVILKGGRKQKMIKMFEVLPFEVNVLSTDEFPIVSVYGNKNREIGCFRGKIDTDGNKILLKNHGPIQITPEINVPKVLNTDATLDLMKNIRILSIEMSKSIYGTTQHICYDMPDFLKTNDRELYYTIALSSDDEFKHILSTNRDQAISDMSMFLKDMYYLDGNLYKQFNDEPLIYIDKHVIDSDVINMSNNFNMFIYNKQLNEFKVLYKRNIGNVNDYSFPLTFLKETYNPTDPSTNSWSNVYNTDFFPCHDIQGLYQRILINVKNMTQSFFVTFMEKITKNPMTPEEKESMQQCIRDLTALSKKNNLTIDDIKQAKTYIYNTLESLNEITYNYSFNYRQLIYILDEDIIKRLEKIDELNTSVNLQSTLAPKESI